MDFAGPEALLERIATAEREVVFLVGAPLTAPSGGSPLGVPGVAGMVERIKALFRERPRALRELERQLEAEPNRYQAAFRHVLQFRGPDAANVIIREAVLEARLPQARLDVEIADETAWEQLENDLDGWHYPPAAEALGRLVAEHPRRFGRTVLTTNFDPLVELSIRRARGRAFSTVLHGDGILEQSRGEGCHVVHVHGYWHGTDTLHSPLQLVQDRPQLRASLARLLNHRTFVVIAYGGWDDIFTRTLHEVTADQGAFPDVLWCFYDRDPARIQADNARLFDELRPAIVRHRATFYAGIDCHAFLPELAAEVRRERGGPGVAAEADGGPARDDAAFIGRAAQRDALLRSLERGQPAQLIGPRRMGKSSLLRWVERTARAFGRPAAFVNARGLAGRSPSDLVLAAGEALGRKAQVKAALFAESALPGSRAAERALGLLAPACLLVDEADALAERDHGFDRGFFDALRALGQEGKLSWISASEHDLFEVFKLTGLTSAFLNDARKIHVGALSREEAERFMEERTGGATHAAWAWEIAGGFPPALGWIADRLAEGRRDLDEVEREFGRWIAPLFGLWWQRLDEAGRGLLKRCAGGGEGAGVGAAAGEGPAAGPGPAGRGAGPGWGPAAGVGERLGVRVEELGDAERRRGRALVDAGFLVEGEGRLRLEGRAWQDFVRHAA